MIYCRDNLVPGATGPNDWDDVAREFNAHFADVLRKPLASATMSRRWGVARKVFLMDNPEYEEARRYPIPADLGGDVGVDEDEDEDEDEVVEEEYEEESREECPMGVIDPTLEAAVQHFTAPTPSLHLPPVPSLHTANISTHSHLPLPFYPVNVPTIPLNPSTSTLRFLPGSYNPSAVHDTSIPPLTRIKFHLRHRASEPATFQFLNPDENKLAKELTPYIDASLLIAASPFYAAKAQAGPEDMGIRVPPPFALRTVNIFIQLVSPERATKLPTHYLWKAKKGVPGIYDRFGGIEAEKIDWSVDVLFDIFLFARDLGVLWIVDMVIDRLFFLFDTQNRNAEAFGAMGAPVKGYVNVGGRKFLVGSKLPAIDTSLPVLSADDFSTEVLQRLAVLGMPDTDIPTLRFVSHVMNELHANVDNTWLLTTAPAVQAIFRNASPMYLELVGRDTFCARYHHHSPPSKEHCYTAHPSRSALYYIDALYATDSLQEMVKLSDGLPVANQLVSIMYSGNGDASKLRKDNSSKLILGAEKMVLANECRLEEAKGELATVCEAREEEREEAAYQANCAARNLCGTGGLEGLWERSLMSLVWKAAVMVMHPAVFDFV